MGLFFGFFFRAFFSGAVGALGRLMMARPKGGRRSAAASGKTCGGKNVAAAERPRRQFFVRAWYLPGSSDTGYLIDELHGFRFAQSVRVTTQVFIGWSDSNGLSGFNGSWFFQGCGSLVFRRWMFLVFLRMPDVFGGYWRLT